VPSPILYSGPRIEKYTSKTVSNERQWALFFTIVAPKRVLECIAIFKRNMPHRFHGIKILRQ